MFEVKYTIMKKARCDWAVIYLEGGEGAHWFPSPKLSYPLDFYKLTKKLGKICVLILIIVEFSIMCQLLLVCLGEEYDLFLFVCACGCVVQCLLSLLKATEPQLSCVVWLPWTYILPSPIRTLCTCTHVVVK